MALSYAPFLIQASYVAYIAIALAALPSHGACKAPSNADKSHAVSSPAISSMFTASTGDS